MIFCRKSRTAIQRSGQNTGHSGLSDAAMTAENVAVGGATLFDGVLQSAGDVLLSDHLGEFLWTVFAGQDGVAHGQKSRLYGNGGGDAGERNTAKYAISGQAACEHAEQAIG